MIQRATGKPFRVRFSFSKGTALLRYSSTFLWVSFLWVPWQLLGYNVTVILALTSQQTLCTVQQQGGSIDLASEWQLKHLCLQTDRLTGF